MRKVFVLFCLAAMTLPGYSQIFPGYRTGNYTGVNGVFFNPAYIADSRYKWDVNLFAINGFVGTNQRGLRFSDITRSFNGDSLKSKLLRGSSNVRRPLEKECRRT